MHLHRVEGLNGGQHRMRVTLAGDTFQSPVGLAPPILHDAELCHWNVVSLGSCHARDDHRCHRCHDSCQPFANHLPTIWESFGNHFKYFKSSANKLIHLILVPQADGLFWDLPRYRQGKRKPKGTHVPVKRLPMRRLYGPKGWCNLTISHNVTQCSSESLQNHSLHSSRYTDIVIGI